MESQAPRTFVIIGTGRSGSTMLRTMLHAHPEVHCYGELFGNDRERQFRWETDRETTLADRELRDSDPVRFLRERVIGECGDGVSTVGFKLFYHHARDERFASIRDQVLQDSSIRILHVTRRNLLAQIVSFQIAMETGRWSVGAGSTGQQPSTVTLDPAHCLRHFGQILVDEEDARREFDGFSMLEVEYESLRDHRQFECDRILDFLELPRRTLDPSTRRQERRPLSEVIANYDELRAAAYGTPWQRFFTYQ